VETWVAAKEINVVQPILEGFKEDFQKLIRDYLAADVEWSITGAAKKTYFFTSYKRYSLSMRKWVSIGGKEHV
jgi:hypothetical protein